MPKLRFEVLAVDESRLKGTMRKISFGMHIDHFCMTVIRDKAKGMLTHQIVEIIQNK